MFIQNEYPEPSTTNLWPFKIEITYIIKILKLRNKTVKNHVQSEKNNPTKYVN